MHESLPITSPEPDQDGALNAGDEATRAEIKSLVEHFYAACAKDPMIGPIFLEHVADWDAHLETMQVFWESAIYKTGHYSGRPIEAHQQLPNLRPEHFDRWLALWETSVDECVSDENKRAFKHWAGLMARSFSRKV